MIEAQKTKVAEKKNALAAERRAKRLAHKSPQQLQAPPNSKPAPIPGASKWKRGGWWIEASPGYLNILTFDLRFLAGREWTKCGGVAGVPNKSRAWMGKCLQRGSYVFVGTEVLHHHHLVMNVTCRAKASKPSR